LDGNRARAVVREPQNSGENTHCEFCTARQP